MNIENYNKKFLNYVYLNFPSIKWRGPLLSIRDLLERIITIQDYECLKFVFYNYKYHIEIIDILFFDLSKISYYSDEYRERYLKVIHTFNYLRFSGKRWEKDYVPKLIMDDLSKALKEKRIKQKRTI